MNPRKLTVSHRIRFAECDPAGIVFYPQYFVMFNNLLEKWVDAIVPEGFAAYVGKYRFGLPTVHLEANFVSVSRMGDDVELSLEVQRVGGKSLTLLLECRGAGGEVRMRVNQVLVSTSLETHLPVEIPMMLREALTQEPINE